jgi:hypothetical protein
VTDNNDREVAALGREEQVGGGLPNLSHAAGRRRHLEREHRLNGVHDQEGRTHAVHFFENSLHACFGQKEQWRVTHAEPFAAHLHLML